MLVHPAPGYLLLAAIAAYPAMQTPAPDLAIDAHLAGDSFAIGEAVPLVLTLANRGATALQVPDPSQSGREFLIRLRLPDGRELVLAPSEAARQPGVPDVRAQLGIPPGRRRTLDFNLAELARLEQAGDHSLRLEYEWQPAQTWRSGEMRFAVTSPAATWLDVAANEATRSGFHGLLWTERGRGGARALLAHFRVQDQAPEVRDAVEIGFIPADARPAISTAPAGKPFPDRWFAWIAEGRLMAGYHAQAPRNRLPPRAVPLPGKKPELIRPLLAAAAAQTGRAGCLAGILLRDTTELLPVEIDRRGGSKALPRVRLPGPVRQAWATAPSASLRLFVFAGDSQVVAVSCESGRACSGPTTWFGISGEVVAGDVRSGEGGEVRIGLVLRTAAGWELLTGTAPPRGRLGRPATSPLRAEAGAEVVRARLDPAGALHVLLRSGARLLYFPPGAEDAVWWDERPASIGRFFDLVPRPGLPPALVYYDSERGPRFVTLAAGAIRR